MKLRSVLLWATVVTAQSNDDVILPPPAGKEKLAEKLLILVPGANVATSYYTGPSKAIQQAANLRLWVVVPSVPAKLCISICPSSSVCAPLHALIGNALSKAQTAGYNGSTAAPDAFVAGHSLGGVCAANLVQGYANSTGEAYAGLIEMGSYVTDHKVSSWPSPVLTIGGELDGGAARPGVIATKDLVESDAAAKGHDEAWVLTNKPVAIIPGIDHSSFCPGFHVPGDVFPADVDEATSDPRIGALAAAFLHLNTEQEQTVKDAALTTLRDAVKVTRELVSPLLTAIAMEGDIANKNASYCIEAQHVLSGLSDADQARLSIGDADYETDVHQWEHTRVHYSADHASHTAVFNVSGRNQYYDGITDLADNCIVAAHEIGCKMASADRVAEQLGVPAGNYTNALRCKDMNKHAYDTAIKLLSQTDAGRTTLARYQKRGRPVCYEDDFKPIGSIGPLFTSGTMTIKDNGTCLVTASLSLGPQPLDSFIFPGTHYCKMLSPARVIDWIMIDSLKDKGGCLNT